MPENSFQFNEETPAQALLSEVAKGDESAFKILFENWYPFLASHIFRVTRSQPITEEIVQDVFLKIWLTRETLAEINDFKAYLIIVSRNHAFNALRKIATEAKRHEKWISDTNQTGDTDPSAPYYSLIDEAIDQLSDRQKEVYLLHRHQRLTYDRIARRLQVSRETVKSHLQAATSSITKYIRKKMATQQAFLFFLLPALPLFAC